MTEVGYRKTSPPQVFVDFSREALEAIGEGNFSLYKDPLDLKNSMKSFSYTLTKGDVPGRMDIQLIDPSQRVEADLFAWFAAINPRSWRAKQDAPDPENAAKYWAAKALESVKFFVRWGYISDPEDSSSPATALSHIHEVLLFDIGYEVSDKQERVVTLQLQTQQDISLMRQADHATKMFDQTIRTPIERATPEGIVLKEPAEIVTEMIGRLISGGGTIGGCFPSEEQREVINRAFDAVGTRDLPTADDLDFLENASFDASTRDGRLMGYTTVLDFFNGLGMDVVVNIGTANPSPAPDRTLAPAQNTRLAPANYRPTPERPVLNAIAQIAEDNAVFKVPVTTNAVDLLGERSVDPPAPQIIGDAVLINPFKIERERFVREESLGTYGSMQVEEEIEFYSDSFTREELQRTLEEDKVYLLPSTRSRFYGAVPGSTRPPGFNVPNDSLAVSQFIQGAPLDVPGGAISSRVFRYKPSEHPELEAFITATLNNDFAGTDEIRQEANLEELQQVLIQEDIVLRDNPIRTAPPPPTEEIDIEGSYIAVTTPSRDLTLQRFLDKLNTTFFEDAADYLTYTHIPLSLIDRKDREEFQRNFANTEIEWEKDTGLTLVSTLRFANNLIAFMGKIDSFDIQIPEKPERVILSTGFSKNKTNIITDLSYRQSKAGWFFEFLQSPIIMQQVYDIARRYEDPQYRDAVWRHIELQIDPEAVPSIIRVYPEGSSDSTQFDPSGQRYFPEELAERAFNAAVRSLTDTEGVQDSSISNPERQRLARQVAEDLQFLRENELIESFFPRATTGQLGVEGARAIIGIETGRETYRYSGGRVAGTDIFTLPNQLPNYNEEGTLEVPRRITESFAGDGSLAADLAETKTYRFITNNPLQSLTDDGQLDSNDPDRFGPTLLAQKMRVLQAFKKRIMNVRLRTLGIPEMDVFAYEINKRRIGLIVSEPRVPGTYHWLSGMYYAIDVTHKISPEDGYTTEIELLVNDNNTQEEMLEVSFTFLEDSDD